MIDRWNAVLTVKEIHYPENERDSKYHIMEKSEDLRRGFRYFTDEEGKKYPVLGREQHRTEDGKMEYKIEFEDEDLILPLGTVLRPNWEDWRKKIPESEVISLEYQETIMPPQDAEGKLYFEIYDDTAMTVYRSGKVVMSKPVSMGVKRPLEAVVFISPERAERYFREMLRCVSEVDCYQQVWDDDTGRGFTIRFANGEVLKYSGIYFHDYGVSDTITKELMEELQKNVTIESETRGPYL